MRHYELTKEKWKRTELVLPLEKGESEVVLGKMTGRCSTGCFGSLGAELNGDSYRSLTAFGNRFMPVLRNGGTMVRWNQYFMRYPQMRTWRI